MISFLIGAKSLEKGHSILTVKDLTSVNGAYYTPHAQVSATSGSLNGVPAAEVSVLESED